MPAAIAQHSLATKAGIPTTTTSHPENPIPEEPQNIPRISDSQIGSNIVQDSHSTASNQSVTGLSETDSDTAETPTTEHSDNGNGSRFDDAALKKSQGTTRARRASTALISESSEDVQRILGNIGAGGTQLVEKVCCGGGCCLSQPLPRSEEVVLNPIRTPDNHAYRSLNLKIRTLALDSVLTNIVPLPEKTVSFGRVSSGLVDVKLGPTDHPPKFVQPHPPYEVFRAPLHHARELTKPGAEKRTYHFDIDVTDYPVEGGDVDFVVGGAIGVCPMNSDEAVDSVFNCLGIPKPIRDKKLMVRTAGGRWPTIWGEEQPRELVTTRRELLKWCSDIQSYPPTKQLLRVMAEYASDPHEKKILMFLCSAQGQSVFCDLRTGVHVSLEQLLQAFPSSQPPLDYLLSVLGTLMPRFYSLSQDPTISCTTQGEKCRRLIEIAVTVHESNDWKRGTRTGVSSGFLQRLADQVIAAEQQGIDPKTLGIHVPMFRGLMANPLAREFVLDGPMLLIGAGVGIAPFRGFVQRRLKSANCANKVWVLQGIRDSLLDELYSGEWGVHEEQVKKVVQSRRGESRYVQEEVRHQADLVWFVINALDGRVFVCGSSKGMGEGVEEALIDVAMAKGNLNREQAKEFWGRKKEAGQYIAETW
ncbi:FAD binding domain protein [Talaromyces stipitatus ATCC 10500]|uniref:FAD binding domain protein n=1 Tax=Talaromyces stipitatus (strain ATCC 10500 / CBS 375.48 / QM 6759 / NRRL 1006) TaxID=441959 RepID=B8MKV7_TALSN|nr:FAD binding domain protein [Talaromyces stipitatus ATCC 10500]EED14956.1 FAD binding domain protein [Talaromyces stipitatus ATCC 10500]